MMNHIKSIVFSLAISLLFLGVLYIIPININAKSGNALSLNQENDMDTLSQGVETPMVIEEEETPITKIEEEKSRISVEPPKEEVREEAPVEEPINTDEEKTITDTKTEKSKKTKNQEKLVDKKAESSKDKKKKEELKKEETKEESSKTAKNSKIGVDRKLISGIPGTNNYRGKFPTHNVKEKGSITITYIVNPEGKVISAKRTGGLRSKTAINNAVSMIKTHVKAEKSKTNSTGTYTIEFK